MGAGIPPCSYDSLAKEHVSALGTLIALRAQLVYSEQCTIGVEYLCHKIIAVFGTAGALSYEFVESLNTCLDCVCVVLGHET